LKIKGRSLHAAQRDFEGCENTAVDLESRVLNGESRRKAKALEPQREPREAHRVHREAGGKNFPRAYSYYLM
jgi:hypothetical protein